MRYQSLLLCGAFPPIAALAIAAAFPPNAAFAEDYNAPAQVAAPPSEASLKQQIIDTLPAPISQGLEVNGWAWLSYMHANRPGKHNFYDLELSLDVTKAFSQQLAATVQANFIDANGDKRVELEQAYVSMLPGEATNTIITVGKFNARIGLEPRDFWSRSTATTSLLFGASPQDLVGLMVTQPIGDTGFKIRPFISLDFQGQLYADQPPSAGLTLEYNSPQHAFHFQVTNWVGPGVSDDDGHPLRQPYHRGSYGDAPGVGGLVANWQGPNFVAFRAGTLDFLNANASWHPRRDLTLSAEYLVGKTLDLGEPYGWEGASGLINFDLTDQWAAYGRISYLDDKDWMITGAYQCVYEASVGVSFRLNDKLEVRAEFRHDRSSVFGDVNSGSIHLTVGF